MYTHKIELVTGDCNLEADIQFNGTGQPRWKSTNGAEMSIETTAHFRRLLEIAHQMYDRCDGLVKLQIEEK